MGKKDKKKGKGLEKTAVKTEKNLAKKLKKTLAKTGEESVEKMVTRLAAEQELRKEVVETVVPPPAARSSFTLCAHPERDELLLYGGEYFNGKNTTVYGDLFLYRGGAAAEWRHLQLPRGPPPRCGHAAVTAPPGGGQMWLFGGEFSSPSGEQFHHYRDLWCLHINQRRWEKLAASGGPSARSGHRMVYTQKQLIVFGGFHDNTQSFQYFDDTHAFDIEKRQWRKLEVSGQGPSPRSGVVMLALTDGRVLVYGGYTKSTVNKKEQGTTHDDMYLLTPDKHDLTLTRWRWSLVKQGGARPSPRAGIVGCCVRGDRALFFGGVSDQENDDNLQGTFFNDMHSLDADRGVWHTVTLSGRRDPTQRRRRRRKQADDTASASAADADPADQLEEMTIDDASTTAAPAICVPSPRSKAGLAARGAQLFLYGGQVETGNVEVTLSDFYSLDTSKMDEWKVLVEQPKDVDWQGSDDEDMEDEEDDGGDEGDDDEDDDEEDDEDQDDSEMEDEDL